MAAHLVDWFEEFRTYHRKDGLIVKLRDDLMSASRIGVMMLRYARVSGGSKPKPVVIATGYRTGQNRKTFKTHRQTARA